MVSMCCLGFTARIAAGQSAGVELRFDSLTLEPGESVNGQLVCTNIGDATLPPLPASDGYELRLLNPTPATSQMMSIVNGQTTQRITQTYTLRLTALKEGSYSIGPIVVSAGGRSFPTPTLTLQVRKSETSPSTKGDRLLFAEIDVSPRSIYVTQEVQATLTFGLRRVEIGGRTYDLDPIRQVLDLEGSELSVFAGGQASRSEVQLPDAKGVRHTYLVYRVVKSVRGEEAGPLRIGPVFLRADYPTAVRSDFFGRAQISRSSKETARTEAIVVDVKGPPLEGRPESFTGSIGQFRMEVTAKPDHVEQGEPLTLSIAIEGAPLAGVAGPDLARIPEAAARFDFSQEEPAGDIEGSKKVFRRALFPKQFGDQTIPPIEWSYFDPKGERYVTLSSSPIAVAVAPRTGGDAGMAGFDEPGSLRKPSKLTVLSGGISPIVVDVDAILADQTLTASPSFLTGVLCAPPLAYAIAAWVARTHRRLRSDPGYARRRRALNETNRLVRRAWAAPDPAVRGPALAEAIRYYLGERYNLAGGALTPDEVRALLESHHVDTGMTHEIAAFLETADAARYSPGAAGMSAVERFRDSIPRWLTHLERHRP